MRQVLGSIRASALVRRVRQARVPSSDDAFDEQLPSCLQIKSSMHFTPLVVARQAATLINHPLASALERGGGHVRMRSRASSQTFVASKMACDSLRGQREVDRRAATYHTFGPYPATVAMDDPLNRREPYPGSCEVAVAVETLERAEELRRKLHVETGAVIADKVDRQFPTLGPAHLDSRDPARGELPCVAEQVIEDDAEQPRVADRRDPLLANSTERSGAASRSSAATVRASFVRSTGVFSSPPLVTRDS
jgi:hypothetical protein